MTAAREARPWLPPSHRAMTPPRSPPRCVPGGPWLILAADARPRGAGASRRRSSASSPIRGASATCCSPNGPGSSCARSRRRTRRRCTSWPRSAPTKRHASHPSPRAAGRRRGALAALAAGFDDALATTTDWPAGRPPHVARDEGPSPARLPHRPADRRRARDRPGGARAATAMVGRPPPAKEFGLLALLAAHPGRAYTRRELLHRSGGRAMRAPTDRGSTSAGCAQDRAAARSPHRMVTFRGVGYRLDDRPRMRRPPWLGP